MSDEQPQTTQSPHGFDKDVLLSIYSVLNAAQQDYNERKWETIRTASLLTLGLLAGIGGLAASDVANSKLVIGGLGVFLLLIGTAIVIWTRRNIQRESSLQFHVEFPMFQIEKLLGAHKEIPEDFRWSPRSKYIFGQKHLSYQYGTEIDPSEKELASDPVNVWVKSRLKHHVFIDTVGGFALILLSIFVVLGVALILTAVLGTSLQPAVVPTPTP